MQDKLTPQLKYLLFGAMCLMLALASHGLAISTILGPLLARLGGSEWFSRIAILNSIAICVMTPIGGSLSGMAGPGKIVKIFGSLAVVLAAIMAFATNLYVFLICSVLLAVCQGAYASLPFVIVNLKMPRAQSPKYIGYLTMISAIGAPLGSYGAGFLADHGVAGLGILFPALFLIPAIFLIGRHGDHAAATGIHLDWAGILLLVITLAGILMGLNNGPAQGWFSRGVMTSFFVGFAGLVAFIWWENKTAVPLIPMRIFQIKTFALVIMVGFLYAFYMQALNVYMPQAVQNVMQASSAISGSIQLPRSAMMLICPAIISAWVMKKTSNIWKSLAMAGLIFCLAFGLMVFTGPHMPVWFLMCAVALTGIAEVFRSVGLMPAVQRSLPAKDMAVGTSVVGFIMTLANSVSAAFFGLAYNSLTTKTPGLRGMTDGIDTICLLVAFLAFIGAMIVIFFVRPNLDKETQA